MAILGKAGAGLALVAMCAGAMPAEAKWDGPRHRGHDRIDGGDVLLGAVLAGGLIALLSSKKKQEQAPPPEVADEEDHGAPAFDARVDGDHGVKPETRSDEDAAVDACVASAESEGRRYARVSKIDAVSAVDPQGPGWVVRGTLWLRSDYRERGGDRRAFSCRVGEQGVEGVMIDGGRLAAS